jgi:hypothetical protein
MIGDAPVIRNAGGRPAARAPKLVDGTYRREGDDGNVTRLLEPVSVLDAAETAGTSSTPGDEGTGSWTKSPAPGVAVGP